MQKYASFYPWCQLQLIMDLDIIPSLCICLSQMHTNLSLCTCEDLDWRHNLRDLNPILKVNVKNQGLTKTSKISSLSKNVLALKVYNSNWYWQRQKYKNTHRFTRYPIPETTRSGRARRHNYGKEPSWPSICQPIKLSDDYYHMSDKLLGIFI